MLFNLLKNSVWTALEKDTMCLDIVFVFVYMWWVDSGWTPGAHQSRSITRLSWTGETKYNERLTGCDEDRTRPVTNYHHGQNRLNLGKLVYLTANQIRVG